MTGLAGRLGRFQMVGLLGALLQLAAASLLARIFPWPAAATAVAVEVAVLHNFFWHERFTWRDRGARGRVGRALRFHAGNGAVSLLGNTLVVYVLCERGVALLAAETIAIVICSAANFWLADRWVWKSKGEKPFVIT